MGKPALVETNPTATPADPGTSPKRASLAAAIGRARTAEAELDEVRQSIAKARDARYAFNRHIEVARRQP
jgi:hypothetical protein